MSRISKIFKWLALLFLLGIVQDTQAQVKKSLLFGIDGLGYGEQGFGVANTPNMDSLINGSWQPGYRGAYSGSAFAGGILGTETQQITVSGPGWSTMLTGVWNDRHGVTGNGSTFANGDFANNPPYLATLKESLPALTTASYVYWPPIDDYIVSAPDEDADSTNDVDFHLAYMNDANAVGAAASAIADADGLDPDAVFISVDLVDAAGHAGGSSSIGYRQAVETADFYVGQALSAIASRPNFANEDWQIVVTSDHGHLATGGHGGQSTLERTIPFIVASKNLTQGNLPIFPLEVSHADTAPTILDHFGVEIPDYYAGVSRADGSIVVSADINGDGLISGNGTGLFEHDDVTAFVSLWLLPNSLDNPNPADLNLDGIADLGDWAILNAKDPAMGLAIARALSGNPVPEPAMAVSFSICLLGFLGSEWFYRSRSPRLSVQLTKRFFAEP